MADRLGQAARNDAVTGARGLALLLIGLCACTPRTQPVAAASTPAPAPATTVLARPTTTTDVPSASLQGVERDADAAPADPSVDSTFQLPGAFAPDIRVEQLQQRFGKPNVRPDEVPGAEGETSHGVILFPDDPTRRAYLYFQDEDKLSGLQLVRIVDESSRWHFANGVRVGMPLSKLVALNGKPIRFYGFDWDYGGAITDWRGGKLQPAQGKDAVTLGIRLNRSEDAPEGSYPIGEGEFSSDDRHYPQLGSIAIVGEISAGFPGEDDL